MKYFSIFFIISSFGAFGDVYDFRINTTDGKVLKLRADVEQIESCWDPYSKNIKEISAQYKSSFIKENINSATTDLVKTAFNYYKNNKKAFKTSSSQIRFSVEKCIPYKKDDIEIDGWEMFNNLLSTSYYIIDKSHDGVANSNIYCNIGEIKIGKYIDMKVNHTSFGEILFEYGSIIGSATVRTDSSLFTFTSEYYSHKEVSNQWLSSIISSYQESNLDYLGIDRVEFIKNGYAFNQIESIFCRRVLPYYPQFEEAMGAGSLASDIHSFHLGGVELDKKLLKGKRKKVSMENWIELADDHFKQEELKKEDTLFRKELIKKIKLDTTGTIQL